MRERLVRVIMITILCAFIYVVYDSRNIHNI